MRADGPGEAEAFLGEAGAFPDGPAVFVLLDEPATFFLLDENELLLILRDPELRLLLGDLGEFEMRASALVKSKRSTRCPPEVVRRSVCNSFWDVVSSWP